MFNKAYVSALSDQLAAIGAAELEEHPEWRARILDALQAVLQQPGCEVRITGVGAGLDCMIGTIVASLFNDKISTRELATIESVVVGEEDHGAREGN